MKNLVLSYKLYRSSAKITLTIQKSHVPSEKIEVLTYELQQTSVSLENDN